MSITRPNPDLVIGRNDREQWNTAEVRRANFHRLHAVARYGLSLRSADLLVLERNIDRRIGDLEAVRKLTGTTYFSGMVVLRNATLVYENYAGDFKPHDAHTCMSISKTFMNLIVGRLVEEGRLRLNSEVREYIPHIGSGYGQATVQDVLDMNIMNDYSEDYSDPYTTALLHEVAMGWRLPSNGEKELTNRDFLCSIKSENLANPSGEPQYKSANTDVLGWVVEKASGKDLRSFFVDIINAAGLEHTFYLSTDHVGVPNLNGGVCMSARDLARYGLIFVRGGKGIHDEQIGSHAFIDDARECNGPAYANSLQRIHYCNQLQTNGTWIGHGGWGGQFLMVAPDNGTVVVFFSVLENEDASDADYQAEVIAMAQEITELS